MAGLLKLLIIFSFVLFIIFLYSGQCSGCRTQMRSVYLSNKEFKQLSSVFLEKVLLRSDTFLKSTPTEVAKFENFLLKYQPFDCVIDGLNVAFSTGFKKTPEARCKLVNGKSENRRISF